MAHRRQYLVLATALALAGCAAVAPATKPAAVASAEAPAAVEAAQEAPSETARSPARAARAPLAGSDWSAADRARDARLDLPGNAAIVEITERVRQDPEAHLQGLVDALVAGTSSDFGRVRTLHDWVAGNVALDVEAFLGRAQAVVDPYDVVRSGATSGAGYARLFALLCDLAGIEAQVIGGYARGWDFDPFAGGAGPLVPNHEWNAVCVDGGWYLVDCAWDAGSVTDDKVFAAALSSECLFAEPSVFLCTHVPEDAAWQLRDPPLAAEELRNLPLLRPSFSRLSLAAVSALALVDAVGAEQEVVLSAPEDLEVRSLLGRRGSTEYLAHQTIGRRDGGHVRLRVLFPEAGSYRLWVQARPRGAADWTTAAVLGYQASEGSARKAPEEGERAAEVGLSWGEPQGYVYRVGSLASFSFSVPGNARVLLRGPDGRQLGDCVRLVRTDAGYTATLLFPDPGEYRAYVGVPDLAATGSWSTVASLVFEATESSEIRLPLEPHGAGSGIVWDRPDGYRFRVESDASFSFGFAGEVSISLSDSQGTSLGEHFFVERDGDRRTVSLRFPGPQEYTVWISTAEEIGLASLVFVASGSADLRYPEMYPGDYARLGYQIVAPRDAPLSAGAAAAFDVLGPPGGAVAVGSAGTFVQLRYEGGHYRGTATATGATLTLFCGTGAKDGSLAVMARYAVR